MEQAEQSQRVRQRIFVVDDESAIAWTLAIILDHAGFEAHAFEDPRKVMAACQEMAPDLLITDVAMPEMSGIELAIHVRAMLPQCKILLFSGQASTIDLLKKARAEGHDFELVAKPIHPKDLLAKLRG
jgi:DNA-binding NtrC family response regulator